MVLAQNQRWYLGLDLSEAHVAATLLDRATEITYPLHWQIKNHPPIYRFPSAVYFEGKTPDNDNGLFCIGLDAISTAQEKEGGLFIEQFLSYFNLCIPYFESEEHQWQPKLAYRDRQTIPLYWLQKCLQAIVSTLQVNNGIINSKDLTPQQLNTVMDSLGGIVVNCPASWSEAYQFNLREVLLGAELVQEPSQITFVEETIALYLAHHHSALAPKPRLLVSTLVIHAGADCTELMLTTTHQPLTYHQVKFALLNYGGNALEQDLLNHVMGLPEHPEFESLPVAAPPIASIEKFHRYRLNLHLRSSAMGRSLLQEAHQLNFPSHSPSQEAEDNHKELTQIVQQQNLLTNVVGNINLLLNKLLTVTGISSQGIGQVLLGGSNINYLWPYLENWLTQKLPQASLIKLHDRDQDSSLIAKGLALIPLHSSLVDPIRHQYGDLFLFHELLSIVRSDHEFTWEQLQQTLRDRGINLPVCRDRIDKFLAGEVPEALFPDPEASLCLDSRSLDNPDYVNLRNLTLFDEVSDQVYRPNLTQIIYLKNYLHKLWNHGHHNCYEPLFLNL